eukprot:scaffold94477_cov75-Phaeocystis_antarctica.AAC.2
MPHARPSPLGARVQPLLAGRALRVVGRLGCGRVCLRTQRDGRQPPAQPATHDAAGVPALGGIRQRRCAVEQPTSNTRPNPSPNPSPNPITLTLLPKP